MASYPYLISRYVWRVIEMSLQILTMHRTIDPIFGIFIGGASYFAYERRVGREPGHSLTELIAKRFSKEKEA